MKSIAIAGASGFIGEHLTQLFTHKGYKVIKIARNDLEDITMVSKKIEGVEALINLAGANILQRWNESSKKVLYSSRIETTKVLIEAMKESQNPPKTLDILQN